MRLNCDFGTNALVTRSSTSLRENANIKYYTYLYSFYEAVRPNRLIIGEEKTRQKPIIPIGRLVPKVTRFHRQI